MQAAGLCAGCTCEHGSSSSLKSGPNRRAFVQIRFEVFVCIFVSSFCGELFPAQAKADKITKKHTYTRWLGMSECSKCTKAHNNTQIHRTTTHKSSMLLLLLLLLAGQHTSRSWQFASPASLQTEWRRQCNKLRPAGFEDDVRAGQRKHLNSGRSLVVFASSFAGSLACSLVRSFVCSFVHSFAGLLSSFVGVVVVVASSAAIAGSAVRVFLACAHWQTKVNHTHKHTQSQETREAKAAVAAAAAAATTTTTTTPISADKQNPS